MFRSLCLFLSLLELYHGFMILPSSNNVRKSPLFLEKWVAALIDGELDRQGHKEEYQREWMEKNRGAVVQSLGMENNLMLGDDDMANLQQRRKDELMAKQDPQKYCVDRCIATGNCDVFEDLYV